jgi:hypothetical protein
MDNYQNIDDKLELKQFLIRYTNVNDPHHHYYNIYERIKNEMGKINLTTPAATVSTFNIIRQLMNRIMM